jgi:CHASE3 domain sensor protein
VDKFEEMGRKLDEELGRLRRFVEDDLAPETEKRTAQFLREVSEKLTEAAGWLDARRSARETEKSKETSA